MCGICGFWSLRPVGQETLFAMANTLQHRGPDDAGAELYSIQGACVGLGHRRLSIFDLSAMGHQPMHAAGGDVSIVFNGEIYNFKELRAQLDYPFVSECDTEVVLAAYLAWGEDCLQKLNGMFAFAILDKRNNSLFFARDRAGKKPLYYYLQDGLLVFGSELKAILKFPGVERRLRRDVTARFLFQGYIAAPDTIYENMYKLPAGHYARYTGNAMQVRPWWQPSAYYAACAPYKGSYAQAVELLEEKLLRSVQMRMIADVPLGLFLSGGYDSSLVCALAQSSSAVPLKTYCIGFEEEHLNEAGYAKEVARHLGTNHTQMTVTEDEMYELIGSIPQYYDEPFADDSQIPSMLVSRLARQDVTVALSGDGGDELFCGYEIYARLPALQKLDGLGAALYGFNGLPGVRALKLLQHMPRAVQLVAYNRNKNAKTQFGNSYYEALAREIGGEGLPVKYNETAIDAKNWQTRRMLLDMETYLPDDILCKVDRASMKYSLEARSPILDVDVMQFALSLPLAFKTHKGVAKRILKDVAYRHIPKEMLDRPKQGFDVPTGKWLRGRLKDSLKELSAPSYLRAQGVFQPEKTSQWVQDFLAGTTDAPKHHTRGEKMMWHFLMYQLWYEAYMQ